MSIPVLLAAAIERLYDLNVGTTPLEEGAPYEKELLKLLGQALLLPQDEAFHPDAAGLKYRCEQLIA